MAHSHDWPQPVKKGSVTTIDSARLRTPDTTLTAAQQAAWDAYLSAGIEAFRKNHPPADFQMFAFGQQVTLVQTSTDDGVCLRLVHGRLYRTPEGTLEIKPRSNRRTTIPVDPEITLMIRESWLDDFHLRYLWHKTLDGLPVSPPAL